MSGIIMQCALPISLPLPLTDAPEFRTDLITAAQAGDERAFASLYDQHAPRVFAVCVGFTGDREAAAEFTQDTFVRAWERLASFRGDCTFATWLHRVAVNVMLGAERTRKRRSLRVAIAADLAVGADGKGARPDAPVPATDVALAMDLEQAIARLPAGARAVLVLHDLGGYAHAEIASMLSIAEGTSKAHLFRARRLLRGMLER